MISQTYWPDYVKGLPQLALNRDLNPINYNFFGKIATNRDVAQKVGSRFIFFYTCNNLMCYQGIFDAGYWNQRSRAAARFAAM